MPDTLGGISLVLNAREAGTKGQVPEFYLEDGQWIPFDEPYGGGQEKKSPPLYFPGVFEKGDSADIEGRASWSDGYWILELGRALKTPGKKDVQFDSSERTYSFGLAVWDGIKKQQHQVATILNLRFENLGNK